MDKKILLILPNDCIGNPTHTITSDKDVSDVIQRVRNQYGSGIALRISKEFWEEILDKAEVFTFGG